MKMVIFNNFLIIKEPRMFEAASGGRVPQVPIFMTKKRLARRCYSWARNIFSAKMARFGA
jgi:hypothetical protein